MSEEIKTKVCPKCGRELTADMFNLSAKSADGLQSYCKECSKKAALESKKRKFTPPYPLLPNGQEPREVIQEIRERVNMLREVGFEYEGNLYYRQTIKI